MPQTQALYGSDLSRLSPFAAALARKGTLKWAIAITASLGAILEVIDTSIVNVALPDIQGISAPRCLKPAGSRPATRAPTS
jgi:hypothetical protein